MRHPGLRGALLLALLWGLSWGLFYFLAPGARFAGLPLLTWSHIAIGGLAVGLSLAVIPSLEAWEGRGRDERR